MSVFLKHEQLNKDYSFCGTTGRRPRQQSSKLLIDSEHCTISHKVKAQTYMQVTEEKGKKQARRSGRKRGNGSNRNRTELLVQMKKKQRWRSSWHQAGDSQSVVLVYLSISQAKSDVGERKRQIKTSSKSNLITTFIYRYQSHLPNYYLGNGPTPSSYVTESQSHIRFASRASFSTLLGRIWI